MYCTLKADAPGNREGIPMWSQLSKSQKQEPQATALTRSSRRTDFTINMTGGIEFARDILPSLQMKGS